MEERYYGGADLEKDVLLRGFLEELRSSQGVLIIYEPERVLVHKMAPDVLKSSGRRDTGATHVGYRHHYVTFLYGNVVYTLSPAAYFPFTDENHPGLFNFMAFKRVGRTREIQASYYVEYAGFDSLRLWAAAHEARGLSPLKGVGEHRIVVGIDPGTSAKIGQIVARCGGYRESNIWSGNPVLLRSETWNTTHRVVDVVDEEEQDGRRGSFSVDLTTESICG